MKRFCALIALFACSLGLLSGCGQPANKPAAKNRDAGPTVEAEKADRSTKTDEPSKSDKPSKEDKIAAALAKLSPEDRKLAEEQKFCALENKSPLGAMGTPVKIEIEGQTVFLCCKGCEKGAKANPEETLAKVEKLKEANK